MSPVDDRFMFGHKICDAGLWKCVGVRSMRECAAKGHPWGAEFPNLRQTASRCPNCRASMRPSQNLKLKQKLDYIIKLQKTELSIPSRLLIISYCVRNHPNQLRILKTQDKAVFLRFLVRFAELNYKSSAHDGKKCISSTAIPNNSASYHSSQLLGCHTTTWYQKGVKTGATAQTLYCRFPNALKSGVPLRKCSLNKKMQCIGRFEWF